MIIDTEIHLILWVDGSNGVLIQIHAIQLEKGKNLLCNQRKFFQRNTTFSIIFKIHIYPIHIVIVMLAQS